jgi:hypothetical protein
MPLKKNSHRIARASKAIDSHWSVLEALEQRTQSWWSTWKSHLQDGVGVSKDMLQDGYTPSQFLSDWTSMTLKAPNAMMGFLKSPYAKIEFLVDGASQGSDEPVTRVLPRAPTKHDPSALTGPGKAKIDAKSVQVNLNGKELTVSLVNLKDEKVPGEYTGEIDLGGGKTILVDVTVVA